MSPLWIPRLLNRLARCGSSSAAIICNHLQAQLAPAALHIMNSKTFLQVCIL